MAKLLINCQEERMSKTNIPSTKTKVKGKYVLKCKDGVFSREIGYGERRATMQTEKAEMPVGKSLGECCPSYRYPNRNQVVPYCRRAANTDSSSKYENKTAIKVARTQPDDEVKKPVNNLKTMRFYRILYPGKYSF